MARRANYKITSAADRERLIRAQEERQDLLQTTRLLGISKSTAYRILRNGNVEVPVSGGARNVKVDIEMRQFLSDRLSENPLLTLSNLNNKL